MNHSLRGFATLTALGLMILLATYLTLGASASAQIELGLSRNSVPAQAGAWKVLDAFLKALQETWNPTQQRFSAWASAHQMDGITVESLSGRVNLNTISPFLLGQPGFRETLKGISVEQFVETRAKNGPSADGNLYHDIVQPEALKSWYTVHSLWNLDTADEVMLEAMVTQRTGSAAIGSSVRSLVRSFREQKKRFTADDWIKVGAGREALEPLLTMEPELDVNEIPEGLLGVLLANPSWAVADAATKVQALIQGRDTHPWTAAQLKAMLQVPDDSIVLSSLGTRTRFLGGTVKTPAGSLAWVVFLSGDAPDPPSPRIVETRWRVP